MPLTKRAPQGVAPQVASPALMAAQQQANAGILPPNVISPAAKVVAGRLGGERKAGAKAEAPMTKDTYWERKEARDIETGIRIRRSGVWQASLNSVGLLQLNTENTLEGFLALVAKAAEEGLKFINEVE
jgi:hypothetical protein